MNKLCREDLERGERNFYSVIIIQCRLVNESSERLDFIDILEKIVL
jgi:hypothetical protein